MIHTQQVFPPSIRSKRVANPSPLGENDNALGWDEPDANENMEVYSVWNKDLNKNYDCHSRSNIQQVLHAIKLYISIKSFH